MPKVSKVSPQLRVVYLAFKAQRALGLNRFGRPPRAATLPDPKLFPAHQISSSTIAGQQVYRLEPESFDRTLIYLHGGGYVQPISKFHWLLLAQIAREQRMAIVVPRYGLNPKFNVDDALELMDALLGKLAGEDLILAGDSAGGGLALALAQKAQWQQQLSGLLLISPWVDSAFESAEVETFAARDPWLVPDALQYIANAWSAVGDFRRVEVSPLHGEMAGLPKTLVFIGDHDLFYPDVIKLGQKLAEASVEFDLEELAGGLHVYPLLPVPEGAIARAKMNSWLAGL